LVACLPLIPKDPGWNLDKGRISFSFWKLLFLFAGRSAADLLNGSKVTIFGHNFYVSTIFFVLALSNKYS
jgi:hypothetical protein